jgi:alcohol dehydrogenase
MAASNTRTIRTLRSDRNTNQGFLGKYATIGKLFSETRDKQDDYYIDALLSLLDSWTIKMKIPSLKQYGVSPSDYNRIVDVTDNKNNPVPLNHDDMIEVLESSCNRRRTEFVNR